MVWALWLPLGLAWPTISGVSLELKKWLQEASDAIALYLRDVEVSNHTHRLDLQDTGFGALSVSSLPKRITPWPLRGNLGASLGTNPD